MTLNLLFVFQDLVFTAGDEGGVIVKPKVLAEEHSFYVSDDEKSIVIQAVFRIQDSGVFWIRMIRDPDPGS